MKLKDVFNEKYEWEDVHIEKDIDREAWVIVNDGKIVFGDKSALSFEEAKIWATKLAKTVHWKN